MSSNAPITFHWDGEAMVPLKRFAHRCDQQFVVGMEYPLVVHEHRSTATHNHYFAAVHEAWKNLPEDAAERYPTAEHLRKWALIKAGYHDERSIVCDREAEAEKVQAFVRPLDEFAVVIRKDNVVKVYTAKSQSHRDMDKKTFAESKERVLAVLSEVIGVKPDDLKQNTGKAA